MPAAFIPARIPTILDVAVITGPDLRIHPRDLAELEEAYFFCWPGNDERTIWRGTKLVEDAAAPRLARVAL
jgi:hypothetical protein